MADSGRTVLKTAVNGDSAYRATTTRKAVDLLLRDSGVRGVEVRLVQQVSVPIGYGFGASAASALSAVFAVASALDLGISKQRLALFAHRAEILCSTGLGTVSVVYDNVGAGVISTAGAPGVAEFKRVKIPEGFRVVTASMEPRTKKRYLGSRTFMRRASNLGDMALEDVLRRKSFESLMEEGERFATALGLMTTEVKESIRSAKSGGAAFASQNMIGDAIHSVVPSRGVRRLASSLASSPTRPRVDVYDFGEVRAGILEASPR